MATSFKNSLADAKISVWKYERWIADSQNLETDSSAWKIRAAEFATCTCECKYSICYLYT